MDLNWPEIGSSLVRLLQYPGFVSSFWRKPLVLLSLFLLVLGGRRVWDRYGSLDLQVTFFDVGQGDATLIQFPRGKTMLIDAGGGYGDWNAGSRVLFPELARMGILHLDIALLTHPDQDHGFGFRGLFEEITIGEFWYNRAFGVKPEKPRLLKTLLSLAEQKRVSVRRWGKTYSGQLNGVKVALYPLTAKGKAASNNRSLVLFLEYGGCRLLFTGDVQKEGERALVPEGLGPLTLLKVAHHGSRTSSTEAFLRRLQPRLAVISAGLGNPFGFPHISVIRRLHRLGIQILRTDFHGYVRVSISSSGIFSCETAHGNCGRGSCATSLRLHR